MYRYRYSKTQTRHLRSKIQYALKNRGRCRWNFEFYWSGGKKAKREQKGGPIKFKILPVPVPVRPKGDCK
jgi:hypothetical protein